MKPSARVQAAIELLDEIIVAARDAGPPADALIQQFFQRRRYAGSGDRRAIRELVYRAIRRSGERPSSGRAAMLGVGQDDPDLLKLFDWSLRAPIPFVPGEPVAEASQLSDWLTPHLDPLIDDAEIAALLDRATLDLRVNRLKGERDACIADITGSHATALAPWGIRVPEGAQLKTAFEAGLVEVQDEGSQLVATACAAKPGMIVVDLCAGAGGKTLALAADMNNEGRLFACDIDRGRLSRLPPRAQRAGATNIQPQLLNPPKEREQLAALRQKVDVVLVDAPCSGSGTWRRSPELRWRLTHARLDRHLADQAKLIDLGADLVAPGGKLLYAVCSIIAREGRVQVDDFLNRNPGWTVDSGYLPEGIGRAAGHGFLLTPAHDGSDGFFLARLTAPC